MSHKKLSYILFLSMIMFAFIVPNIKLVKADDTFEENDTFGTSTWIAANTTYGTNSSYAYYNLNGSDLDYYDFTVEPGDNVSIGWSTREDPISLNLTLFDDIGTVLNSTITILTNGTIPFLTYYSNLTYIFSSIVTSTNVTILAEHGSPVIYNLHININRDLTGIPGYDVMFLLIISFVGISMIYLGIKPKTLRK